MTTDIRKQIRTDYEKVFSTDEGKRVLSEILKYCHADKPIHVPGDPYSTAHNAGLHSVAQHLSGMLSKSVQQMFDASKEMDLFKIQTRKTENK